MLWIRYPHDGGGYRLCMITCITMTPPAYAQAPREQPSAAIMELAMLQESSGIPTSNPTLLPHTDLNPDPKPWHSLAGTCTCDQRRTITPAFMALTHHQGSLTAFSSDPNSTRRGDGYWGPDCGAECPASDIITKAFRVRVRVSVLPAILSQRPVGLVSCQRYYHQGL